MAVTFLPSDLAIIGRTQIIIGDKPAPIGTENIGESDKPAETQGSMRGVGGFLRDDIGEVINLQFPVRVTSDGKSANWQLTDAMTYEPIAIFKGASSRSLGLELTYINTGGFWSGERISEIERMIKSYFYRTMEASAEGNAPVVIIRNCSRTSAAKCPGLCILGASFQ